GETGMSHEQSKDMSQYFYRASVADFQQIPGGAIAYWLSSDMRNIFGSCPSLSDACVIREGINSGSDDQFLRKWQEVSLQKFSHPTNDITRSCRKWFAHRKGGEFRKWFGNRDYVLNWENDGQEIHDFHALPLDYNGAPMRGKAYFYKPCLSWSRISSGSYSLRYYEQGMTYDSTAPSIFSDANFLFTILGFLNSKVVFSFLEALSPTLDYRITSLGRLPII